MNDKYAKNYRLKYKRYYGIDFGVDFHVHHIDFNHENNSIDNLLLLPRELHERYHMIMNSLDGNNNCRKGLIDFSLSNVNATHFELRMLDLLPETINECDMWNELKQCKYSHQVQIVLFGKKVI